MPAPFTAPNNLVLRYFSYWFLSKVHRRWGTLHWQRPTEWPIVTVTCSDLSYFSEGLRMKSTATGTTWRKENGESLSHRTLHLVPVSLRICMDTKSFVFIHALANSCTPHTIGKLTVYPLTPTSIKTMIHTHASVKLPHVLLFIYFKLVAPCTLHIRQHSTDVHVGMVVGC